MATISTANGRVATGFSKPYVAIYGVNESGVSYTNGQILARGISVSIDVETSEGSILYLDNIEGETTPTIFNGGTLNLNVDGLLRETEALIMGYGEPNENGFIGVGGETKPYCGVGFITRYMSGGKVSYVPMVIPKVMFNQPPINAQTEGESIEWSTQELTAQIFRDPASQWRYFGDEYASEALAEAALKAQLNIQ